MADGQDTQNSAGAPVTGDANSVIDPQAIKMLQQYMTKPQQHLAPPPPKPPSIGQNIKEQAVGMIPIIGAGVQKAIKEQREFQVNEVVNKIAQWDSVYQELQMMSGGDPKKLQELVDKDPRLDAIRKDKKFVKGMQKVFGGDLLSPEKQNTIYHEAMKKSVQLKEAKGKVQAASQAKQQAAQAAAQQPQPKPEQTNSDMLNAMPQRTEMPDPVKLTHLANTMKSTMEMLGESTPKTIDQAGIQALRQDTQEKFGRNPNVAEIEMLREKLRNRPIDDLISKGITQMESGDSKGAKDTFDLVREISAARKGTEPKKYTNTIDLLTAAHFGDKDAKAILDKKRADDIGLAQAKGEAWGAGRSRWQFVSGLDPATGQAFMLPAYETARRIQDGTFSPVPMGSMPSSAVAAAQRFITEVGIKGTPTYNGGAVAEMRKHLGAFDNAQDKAIFAKILQHAPAREPGQAHLWVSGIMEQAIKEGLSPEGRAMAIANKRLMESMGTMRTMLQLPSTDTSMELTYSLVPGLTPDSKYGAAQLDAIDSLAQNAIKTPSLQPYIRKSLEPTAPTGQPAKPNFKAYLEELKAKAKGGK